MLSRIILAVLLPPLGVYLATGLSTALVINIILTFVGYIPGIIHALWIVTKQSDNVNV
jgi:uncharacterized membrane protein YqaE (UPF0057 family)